MSSKFDMERRPMSIAQKYLQIKRFFSPNFDKWQKNWLQGSAESVKGNMSDARQFGQVAEVMCVHYSTRPSASHASLTISWRQPSASSDEPPAVQEWMAEFSQRLPEGSSAKGKAE